MKVLVTGHRGYIGGPLVHIGDIIHAFDCCLKAPVDAIHN